METMSTYFRIDGNGRCSLPYLYHIVQQNEPTHFFNF